MTFCMLLTPKLAGYFATQICTQGSEDKEGGGGGGSFIETYISVWQWHACLITYRFVTVASLRSRPSEWPIALDIQLCCVWAMHKIGKGTGLTVPGLTLLRMVTEVNRA